MADKTHWKKATKSRLSWGICFVAGAEPNCYDSERKE